MSFWNGFFDKVPMLRRWSAIEISRHRQEKINSINEDIVAKLRIYSKINEQCKFEDTPEFKKLEEMNMQAQKEIDSIKKEEEKVKHAFNPFEWRMALARLEDECRMRENLKKRAAKRLKNPGTIYKKRKPTRIEDESA